VKKNTSGNTAQHSGLISTALSRACCASTAKHNDKTVVL